MLSSTTQSDLEQLLAEVDNGWCAYTPLAAIGLGTKESMTAVKTGIGGCLTEEMDRVLHKQGLSAVPSSKTAVTYMHRKDSMRNALGFAEYPEMFEWNDAQRDPDAIKRRIKDALNAT